MMLSEVNDDPSCCNPFRPAASGLPGLWRGSARYVITSYSIHYTKLYEHYIWLLILPELQTAVPDADLHGAAEYVANAIDKYWAKSSLDVVVKIGAVSARKH